MNIHRLACWAVLGLSAVLGAQPAAGQGISAVGAQPAAASSAPQPPTCPLSAVAAGAGRPGGATVLVGEGVQLSWQVAGPPIAVGQPFRLNVQVCPADAVLVRVDARMPEHRHGINYRVDLTRQIGAAAALGSSTPQTSPALIPAQWRADGLMFHMPGRWELRMDVRQGGKTVALTHDVVLP